MLNKILDLEDACRMLKCSPSTIYKYVSSGKLNPLRKKKGKRGDQLYFRKKDLQNFQRPRRGRPRREVIPMASKAELKISCGFCFNKLRKLGEHPRLLRTRCKRTGRKNLRGADERIAKAAENGVRRL